MDDRQEPYREYVYHPLASEQHIRLLKVIRTQQRSKLLASAQFEIVQVRCPLEEDSSIAGYAALSYCWGQSVPREKLLVTAQQTYVRITKNLLEAIKCLAQESEAEYLWIDQVCINQRDDQEKNLQVRRMGEIYTNADRTIAWLASDPTRRLSRKIQAYMDKRKYKEPGLLTRAWKAVKRVRRSSVSSVSSAGSDDESRITTNGRLIGLPWAEEVLELPWFSRGWVVQERLLAKHVDYFFGKVHLNEQAIHVLRMPTNDVGSGVFAVVETNELDPVRTGEIANAVLRMTMRYVSNASGKKSFADELKLLSLLATTFDFRDERDHVYGFLGLLPSIAVAPNYNLTLEESLRDFALGVVAKTASLEILVFASGQDRGGDVGKLASWIPDWRTARDIVHFTEYPFPFDISETPEGWKAADDRNFTVNEASRLQNFTHLKVSGRFVDAVKASSALVDEGASAVVHYHEFRLKCMFPRIFVKLVSNTKYTAEEWHKTVSAYDSSSNLDTSLDVQNPRLLDPELEDELSKQPGLEAAELLKDLRFKSGLHIMRCRSWWEEVRKMGLDVNSFSKVEGAVRRYCADWPTLNVGISPQSGPSVITEKAQAGALAFMHIIETKSGRIGLSPKPCRPGDLIAIVHGCSRPLVLRHDGLSDGHYQVVTSCFIDGIMRGEAVTWAEDEADQFILV